MPDFNASTIRLMMSFIYPDSVDRKEDMDDIDLLSLAYNYEIEPLQKYYEEKLGHNLTVENVIEIWMKSKSLECKRLTHSCQSFVKENWGSVKDSESFLELMSNDKDSVVKFMVGAIGTQNQEEMKCHLLQLLKDEAT